MEVTCKLTKEDVEQLKLAREALNGIICTSITCDKCPLFVNDTCLVNTISRIIHQAERGLT